ncbi:MAG: acyltransferase domain-containing protein [Gammaproteobacteria bacterium]|nr:acyltransferase domain-containing protein [Gammaproteobacteria bacterium]
MTESHNMDNELEPIAIVSMACRFPKADNIQELWRLLCNAESGVHFFSDQELIAAGVDPQHLAQPNYVKAKGMIEGIEEFDPQLFGYTPREAELMDPQQRVLLECAWQLLERAALDPDRFQGDIATYVGVGMNIYLLSNLLADLSLKESSDFYQMLIGSDKDFAASRIAYKLNLTGPAVAVNTACSTSLVAVHYACQSLWDYQSDAAIAGGATLLVPQTAGYLYQQGGIPSADGHCRAFDADAGGTVPSSGAGLVLLKRLDDALRDNDTIYAVIKGSAVNNDGADKVGFTAPGVNGQASVIAEALVVSGVTPDSIDYIEAHGTATPMGDPIEIEALKMAYSDTQNSQHCALGSVKTNLGHMDTAAGIAGLIKTALALHHQQIPASLHFKQANPAIDFAQSPFYVNQELRNWPETTTPCRAAVSSFGIGGTNAHVVLEQAPNSDNPDQPSLRQIQLLPLSARSPQALRQLAISIVEQITREADSVNLADLAYSLAVGRRQLPVRACVSADSVQRAIQSLSDLQDIVTCDNSPQVALMFPGQGAHQVGMGQALYDSEPVFRQHVDHCCEILHPLMDLDLREIIFADEGARSEAQNQLNNTLITQPALFVIEYALAQLLMSWNIKPVAMIGHSLGEYVAACLAGIFSVDNALQLVVERAGLMQSTPQGAMLAVTATQEQCQQWVTEDVALAAVNSASQCVLSGPQEAIDEIAEQLSRESIPSRQLNVEHGFHSPLMQTAASEFANVICQYTAHSGNIPFISNLSGAWFDGSVAPADYWPQHMLQTVRFTDGLKTLCAEYEDLILVEVGPGQVLRGFARPVLAAGQQTLGTLDDTDCCGRSGLQQSVAQLWSAGVSVDWEQYYQNEQRQRLVLPTYPFQRQRCWVNARSIQAPENQTATNNESAKTDLSQWFSTVNWQRYLVKPAVEQTADHYSLMFVTTNTADVLADQEQSALVFAGDSYQQPGANRYQLNPEHEHDFQRLIDVLKLTEQRNIEVLYSWGGLNADSFEDAVQSYLGLLNFCKRLNCSAFQTRCRITVVTRGLFEVTGAESNLSPAQALMLGPVKVVPQEYPQIRCRLIDLPIDLTVLPDVLTVGGDESVLAWRNGYYWRPALEQLEIAEISGSQDLLKTGGCYLITGGLGGVGLSLAVELARQYRARLVLTTHRQCPDQSAWQSSQQNLADSEFNDLLPDLQSAETSLIEELAIAGLDQYPGLKDTLERLCSLHLLQFFQGSDIELLSAKQYTVREISETLGVIDKFDKFLLLLLEILQRDQLLIRHGEQIEFRLTEILDWEEEINNLEQKINHQFPGFKALHEMVAHCVAQFDQALSGQIEAISVLYPDGDRSLISETGEKTVEHSNHRVYYQLLKHFVQRLIDESEQTVRILEVGGGSGVLTGIIVPALQGKNVEYYFTDIGKSFVLRVEQQARQQGLDFMRFAVFDISRDPVEQGFDLHSFDLVYGLDVVHATPDIRQTLTQLSRLLKPGGDLCLVETPPIPRWYEMVWGLAEGWWYFSDSDLRSGTTPLLSADTWQQVMLDSSLFSDVTVFPQQTAERETTDCCLVMGRAPGVRRTQPVNNLFNTSNQSSVFSQLNEIQGYGAEVMVCTADVCDATAMHTVIEQATSQFGAINGVFHAAASAQRGYIDDQDKAASLNEIKPKVLGTQVLQQCLNVADLDFVVLFSSMNAITGGQGNIAYTAANSYLDAFAHASRHLHSTPVCAIDWDRWQSLGQAVAFEQRVADNTGVKLSGGITAAEGFEMIRRALASGYRQLLIQTGGNEQPHAVDSNTQVDEEQQSSHQRPHLSSQYKAPQTPMQELIAGIWSEVLGIEQPGIDDEFAALGGDSLIAIRVVSRLKDTLQMNLEVKLIFECNTIASLSGRIEVLKSASAISNPAPIIEDDEAEYEGGVI